MIPANRTGRTKATTILLFLYLLSYLMHTLAFQDVSFGYDPGRTTVRDITFTVARGEIVSIVGPNGSGKSTLLRLASRVVDPRAGRVTLDERSLRDYSRREIARKLAVVPQEGMIQFPFTVTEVVLMGRTPHGHGNIFESERDHAVAREAMNQTDIAHLADKLITNLSGGERQRVLIARALAQETGLLLLDEPNAHLDIAHQIETFALVKAMNAGKGLTAVAVSHDLNLAAAFSHRILMMCNGEVVAAGTPEEVLTEEKIREVFETEVIVDDHPLYRTPRVTLSERFVSAGEGGA